jgi:hypothetical protein
MPKLKRKPLVVLVVLLFAVTTAGLGAGWKWAEPKPGHADVTEKLAGWTWDAGVRLD